MTECQDTLLQLLSKELFNQEVSLPVIDWLEVLKEATYHAVTQLAYNAIDKDILLPEEAKAWKQASYTDMANSIRNFYHHKCLHRWMSEAKISYVILKGAASAFYYSTPTYRTMGDVDFLIKKEDLEKAGRLLEALGLKAGDKDHISHIVYRAPGLHYEMHFNIAGTPHGNSGNLVREYTKDIFEKSEERIISGGEIQEPSPFHHGLVLLLHTCHHLTGEGIGLRHLCDWAVFENSLSDEEFRFLYEEKLKEIGLWRFAQILTRASIKYLRADEKEWAVCEDEIAQELMEDILTGGNFGKKDSNRIIQKMLISNRGKDGVGNISVSSQFVKSGNNVVYDNWPYAKKNKLLLPVGWVYFGSRRIMREITGKREKTDIMQVVDGAFKRRELYKQFHLYESEL